MKTYYIRMKSLSNLAREVQEIKATDSYAAFASCGTAAANWAAGNGSESVEWWVEDYSARLIGRGVWKAKNAIV